MGVNDDRNLDLSLECGDEIVYFLRAHNACHVLDAQGLAAKLFNLLAELCIVFQRVNRRLGVRNRALCFAACL